LEDARPRFRELDAVCVVRLLRRERHYDGSSDVARPPRIGDTGTVVLAHPDPTAPFCVECVDRSGHTVWLADFDAEELDPA
jgi:hypothetical protein